MRGSSIFKAAFKSMKQLRLLVFTLGLGLVWSASGAPSGARPKDSSVCGSYEWMTPGSTTDLHLAPSGKYTLKVVSNSAGPTADGFRESGTWARSGVLVVLHPSQVAASGAFERCRTLFQLRTTTNKELLVSAPDDLGYDGQTRFDVLFVKMSKKSMKGDR
jgi:hypothetical protein